MLVTLPGMVTLVRLSQRENALSPITVTLFGITTSPPAPLYFTSIPLMI